MKNKCYHKNKSRTGTKRCLKTRKKRKNNKHINNKKKRNSKKQLKGGNNEKEIWTKNINKFRGLWGQKKQSFKAGIIPLRTSSVQSNQDVISTIEFEPINIKQNISKYKLLPTYVQINYNKKPYNKNYWVDENFFIVRTSNKDPDEAPNFSYANRDIDENTLPINFDLSNKNTKFTGWKFLSRELFWLVDESFINKTIEYNKLKYTLEKFITDLDKTKELRMRTIGSNQTDVSKRIAKRIPVWRDNNGLKIFIGWNKDEITTLITPRLRDSYVYLDTDRQSFGERVDREYQEYEKELYNFISKNDLHKANSKLLDELEYDLVRDSALSMKTVDLDD